MSNTLETKLLKCLNEEEFDTLVSLHNDMCETYSWEEVIVPMEDIDENLKRFTVLELLKKLYMPFNTKFLYYIYIDEWDLYIALDRHEYKNLGYLYDLCDYLIKTNHEYLKQKNLI